MAAWRAAAALEAPRRVPFPPFLVSAPAPATTVDACFFMMEALGERDVLLIHVGPALPACAAGPAVEGRALRKKTQKFFPCEKGGGAFFSAGRQGSASWIDESQNFVQAVPGCVACKR